MAATDPAEEIKELSSKLAGVEVVLDLDSMRREADRLRETASNPNLWEDQENAQAVTRRLAYLEGEISRVEGLRRRLDDTQVMFELAESENDEPTRDEAMHDLRALREEINQLEVRTLLSGEYDSREALMTINSQAGGADAADFAQNLMRMYLRWAERHGYPTEIYDTSYAEEAGIKSTTFAVKVPYAYGWLRGEHGTHRMVRISKYDNQDRRPHRDQRGRDQGRCLPVQRARRAGRQHHRLGGPDHPPAHRHRGVVPERAEPAAESGHGDVRAAGEAAGAQARGGGGHAVRAARPDHEQLGDADPQLRPVPLPEREGSAHRRRDQQYRRRSRWRHRRLHRG
jgi:PCRF domain